jgi:tetratricopeptide (TPR) repeat protein
MIYYLKIACLLLFVIEINACGHNHSKGVNVPSKECIELNNRGVDYLMKFPTDGEKDINEAIHLLKQAVICDTTYATGYINLAIAYGRKHSYSEQIMALNKVLALTDNDAQFLLEKGKVFEMTNNIDSAKKLYYLAKIGFEKKLVKHPDNADIIKELILLKAIMVGKDEAIKEIGKQIKLHPDLKESLLSEYEYYKLFNRHAFIYNLPAEKNL